jgi:hypothetical protein
MLATTLRGLTVGMVEVFTEGAPRSDGSVGERSALLGTFGRSASVVGCCLLGSGESLSLNTSGGTELAWVGPDVFSSETTGFCRSETTGFFGSDHSREAACGEAERAKRSAASAVDLTCDGPVAAVPVLLWGTKSEAVRATPTANAAPTDSIIVVGAAIIGPQNEGRGLKERTRQTLVPERRGAVRAE